MEYTCDRQTKKIAENITMLKTFMIEKIEEEVISKHQGKMTFHLIDENGDNRSVMGDTYLDNDQRPTGISSKNKRELPLIENLFSNRDKKVIDIDFEKYNAIYDRELDKTVNQLALDTIKEMEKEKKLSYKLAKLFSRHKNKTSDSVASAQ